MPDAQFDQYTCKQCKLSTRNHDRLCMYCTIGTEADLPDFGEAARCHTASMAVARSLMRDENQGIARAARAFWLLIQAIPGLDDTQFWLSVANAPDGLEQVCALMPARIEAGRKFLDEMAKELAKAQPETRLKLV